MRLLLTMNIPYRRWWGGANRSNRCLATALAARGHEVLVVTPALAAPSDERLETWRERMTGEGVAFRAVEDGFAWSDDGVEVHAVADPGRLDAVLAAAIARVRPERVLVSSEDASQRLLRVAVGCGDPASVVYLAHTPQLLPFGAASLSPGPGRERLVSSVGKIITISRYMAREVETLLGRPAHCAHPPHYDAPAMVPRGHRRGAVLLIHASVIKGLPLFLALAARVPELRFRTLPGYATTAEDLAALAAANVELCSNVPDLGPIWADTAAVLVPSLWAEGFGMVAVDAMAQGVPVLVADHTGLREAALDTAETLPVRLIEEWDREIGENGLPCPRVPPQPVAVWEDALRALLATETAWMDQATRSLEAARRFIGGLGIEPSEAAICGPPDVERQPDPVPPDPLAQRLARLSDAARLSLVRKVRDLGRKGATIPRLAPDEDAPAAPSQRGFWLLQCLNPKSVAYNMPCAMRIRGPLAIDALVRGLATVVARHDALHTVVAAEGGEPRLRLVDPFVTLDVLDVSALASRTVEVEVRRAMAAEAIRPFDLAADPPLRARLLRGGLDEHVLLLTAHHVAADGWSLDILLRELVASCAAWQQGREPVLPALPVRYLDYAAWEHGRLEANGEVLRAQVRRLRGVPSLDLPLDRPRSAARSMAAASAPLTVTPEVLRRLRQLAAAERVSLFVVLLTLVRVLLGRQAGQSDFAMGVPVANRPLPDLQGLIGCFVNTVAVRVSLERHHSFRDALRIVREEVSAAFAGQEIPLDKIVEAINPPREPGRNPLIDVVFEIQNRSAAVHPPAGLQLELLAGPPVDAKFDLTISLTETEEVLYGVVEYPVELFDAETIERMIERLHVLTSAVLDTPDLPLCRVDLLTPGDRTWLSRVEVGVPLAGEPLLGPMMDAGLRVHPESIAVRAGEEVWTRETLDLRADQVAAALHARGVRPEDAVGVHLQRTPWLLAAMIGIWRVGGVYVPLDAQLPVERLRWIARHARVSLTLTDTSSSPFPETMLLPLDAVTPISPRLAPHPEQLAYVLYTSGSTGRPKGVGLTHGGAAALLRWGAQAFDTEERSALLASSAMSFDLSIFELLLPLAAGGTVLLVDDVLDLARRPVAASMVSTVPSAAAALADLDAFPATAGTIALGGEILPSAIVERLFATGHVRRVIDLYGPTECTTFATAGERALGGEATIGTPIAGVRIYLLNGDLQRVPAGVRGEIYIAGPGVARGYIGDTSLTAAAFLPDLEEPGMRMYRTGDFARRLWDGRILFLGRLDDLVKVRGYRVQLAEIACVLEEVEGVRASVVTASDRGLHAWVEGEVAEADLRAVVQTRLPAWMQPTTLEIMAALPRTASGKVDRGQLPTALPHHHGGRHCTTATEHDLAALWAALLSSDTVNADTDFFEAGGHSLLATQMIARVYDRWRVRLPLRTIFDSPKLAEFARILDDMAARQGIAQPPEPAAAPPAAETGRFAPVLISQRAILDANALSLEDTRWHVPVAVRVRHPLRVEALVSALDALVVRHAGLRTTYRLGVKGWQQCVEEPVVPLEIVDLSALPSGRHDPGRLCWDPRPFDLTRGPLMRVRLLQLGPEDHMLALTLHHVVTDGWGLRIVVRDLLALYESAASGRHSTLPPLRTTPAALAQAQQARLRGEEMARSTAWWRQLNGRFEPLDLPTDRPRKARLDGGEASAPLVVPDFTRRTLEALGRSMGASPLMTWLTLTVAWLHRYTGQALISVGMPISIRDGVQHEDVVCFFGHTVMLVFQVESGRGFRALLRHVRDQCLSAMEHAEVPPEDSSGTGPAQFRVMFGMEDEVRLPPGWEPVALPAGAAKYELVIALRQGRERLSGAFVYAVEVYDEPTVAAMVESAGRLAEAVAAMPDTPLVALSLADDAPRCGRILRTAADTVAAVRRWALETPRAVAILEGDREWSYGELWASSGALARSLRSAGVSESAKVGVLLPRGASQVIALFGVWRAGAAAVVVDPSQPPMRRLAMLRGCAALVAGGAIPSDHPFPEGVPVVSPPLASFATDVPDDSTEVRLTPGRAAVIVYTSGSTGAPKGVLLSHGALANLGGALRATLAPGPGERVVRFAAPGFDATLWEILMALTSGSALAVLPEALRLDGAGAVAWLRASRATFLTAPPSWLASLPYADLPDLHTLVAAGEDCPAALATCWGEGRRFFNAYGPTEAGICVTMHLCGGAAGPRPTLGEPIPNTIVRVLDAAGHPVPAGAVGELWVEGPGLADGYVDEPSRTADAFRPAPGGIRRYRTGDRVRLRPDGALVFVGRFDRQRKLRGQRVEPDELEAALRDHPEVRDAAVDVIQGQLVAWVVAEQQSAAGLRSWLAERLPTALLPRAVIALDRLPLTPNGKVDRAALPMPVPGPAAPPASQSELKLLEAWRTLLGAELGVEDDFYFAGGDSLSAMRLVGEAARHGLSIRAVDILELRTIRALAAHLERAGPRLLQAQDLTKGAGTAPPSDDGGSRPLTPLQEGMLFECAYAGQPGLYIQQVVYEIEDEIDPDALAWAWQRAVDLHPALRTSFGWQETRPVQTVHSQVSVPFALFDIATATDPEAVLAHHLAEDRARDLPVDRAPLLRLALLRRGPDHWWLVWTHHHLILDARSYALLVADVLALYRGARSGKEPALPVRRPFSDYLSWLAAWPAAQARDWWANALRDAPVTRAPMVRDAARAPAVQTLNHPLALGPGELARRRLGLTLATVGAAAWAQVLARHEGTDDVIFGTVVSGRPAGLVGADQMIGLFIQTVPLRVRMTPGCTAGAWMKDLQRTISDVAENCWIGLVEFGALAGRTHGQRLFESLFVIVEPGGAPEPGAPRMREVIERTSFPLTLSLVAAAGGGHFLHLRWGDGTAQRSSMERLARQFEVALQRLLEEPEAPVAALDIRPPEELTVELDLAPVEAPTWVPELIRAASSEHPEALAVVSDESSLCYRQLWAESGAVAAALVRLGVRAEEPVLLVLQRNPFLAVAVLGALRVGAAPLCVPPGTPAAQIGELVERYRVRHVLNGPLAFDPSGTPPVLRSHPERLAALVWTSGTTGAPRVIALTHGALANRLRWAQTVYPLGPGDVLLHTSGLGFDFSLWELLGPLTAGATVALLPGIEGDPQAILDAIPRLNVTAAHFVPSVLETVLEHPAAACLARLRLLWTGGEALVPPLVAGLGRLRAPLPINQYGPAEATIDVTWHCCQPDEDPVPIGKPIDGARIYLLDSCLRPIPHGATGEIFIGGVVLGRGFLGEPGATAARFVPDPFSPLPGARMFGSGDLAWRRPDGALVWCGRRDDLLKVRGVRIDPADVEARLRSIAGVQAAALVATGEGAARKLVAWVRPADIEPARVLAALAERVPAHALPTRIVPTTSFPALPSGKVDRVALARIPLPELRLAKEPPLTDDERAVERIWAEVLGLPEIPRSADLWSLGGHSLIAARILARTSEVLGRTASWKELVREPTVAGMAARLRPAGPLVTRGPEPSSFPLLPQHGLVLRLEAVLGRSSSVISWSSPPMKLDVEVFRQALADVVARHVMLRCRLVLRDGRPWADAAAPEQPFITDATAAWGEPGLEEAFAAAAAGEFEPGTAPPWRVDLLAGPEGLFIVLLTIHHLLVDGASLRVLVEQLAETYALRRAGGAPLDSLSEPSYADYVGWLNGWRGSSAAQRALERGLGELMPPPEAPGLRDGGGDGPSTLHLELPTPLWAALCDRARRERATPQLLITEAVARGVGRLGGAREVVVATVTGNRHLVETRRMVGLLANTVALRVPTETASLGSLQQRFVTLLDEGFLPFDDVIAALPPAMDWSERIPVIVAGIEPEIPPRKGQWWRPVDAGRPASTFDVIASVTTHPDGVRLRLDRHIARLSWDRLQSLGRAVSAAIRDLTDSSLPQV